MDKNDGGPAFPHVNPNYDGNWDMNPQRGGMSLRDWFAGQAMQGMLAGGVKPDSPEDLAMGAYMAADAMLSER